MRDRQELVRLVARIWRSHYKQQNLYRSLMSMVIPCRLRKLCATGHMSSLVLKNEINEIYESIKCPFSDGDLRNITRKEDAQNSDSEHILATLIDRQKDLAASYKLVTTLCHDLETRRICENHLEKIKDLNQVLQKEHDLIQGLMYPNTAFESVA